MSEPKRYTISGLHPHIIESKDGFMVYYEDYARLKAEVERLRNLATKIDAYVDVLVLKNGWLRKAGDNLERVLTSRSGSYEAGNASHEWQSAKNYKPSV